MRALKRQLIVGALLWALLCLGCSALLSTYLVHRQLAGLPTPPDPTYRPVLHSTNPPPRGVDFETAAEKGVPAVVAVTARLGGLDRLFAPPQQVQGSGIVVAPEGYIVTNLHVVDKAETVHVALANRTDYEAEVIATDPGTDLAVLKIAATDLPTLAFANSDKVRLGQWVLAVGNPFTLTSTVTAGIVSAKARSVDIGRLQRPGSTETDFAIDTYLQTDAAVNPGNSGGPLLDLAGDVVGINTAIATESGLSEGYSFAIPANLVRKVVQDLVQYGSVQRGLLGVSVQDVGPAAGAKPQPAGARVVGLVENSAAHGAGLNPGDIIVELGGTAIHSASGLQERLALTSPGDSITLTYRRNNTELSTALVLHNAQGSTTRPVPKRPLKPLLQAAEDAPLLARVPQRIGANFAPASTSLLQNQHLAQAVQVSQVQPGGRAAQAGLQVGFLIKRAGGRTLKSTLQLYRLLAESNEPVALEGTLPSGEAAIVYLSLE